MINKRIRTNIFFSSIIIFLIGVLFHFTYELSNNSFIVGLITPVNESIFEHLKLALFPIIIWWVIFYKLKKNKLFLNKGKWFLGCLSSIIVSIITILGIYYFVRYGLGIESVIIDIIILYVAILFGQLVGYHVYKYAKEIKPIYPITMIIVIVITFIILTINPPKIPLFEDSETHTYGINEEVK